MHVKDLLARYEACAASAGSAPPQRPSRQQRTYMPSSPSARVRELRERLEAAVQRAQQFSDMPSRSHSVPASRYSTLSSAAAGQLPTMQQQKDSKGVQLSSSPRAVEAGHFPPAPPLDAVPLSVAVARDLWAGKDAAQAARSCAYETSVVLDEVNANSEARQVVKLHDHGDRDKRLVDFCVDFDDDTTRVISSAHGDQSENDSSEAPSPHSSSEFLSGSDSESMGLIQPIEDVSDVDDLDNIDGVQHIDVLDSQEDESVHDMRINLRRVQVADLFEDDDHATSPQPEVSGPDEDFCGIQEAYKHADQSSGAKLAEAEFRRFESGLDNDSDDHEAVTSVEDGTEDDNDDVEGGSSGFSKSSRNQFESRISSSRPRPSAPKDGDASSSLASAHVAGLGPQTESVEDGNRSMGRAQNISVKRLPKAKVVIARRRGQSLNLDFSDDSAKSPLPSPRMAASMDERGVRRLVREYSNPRQLLEGQVSMVDLFSDSESTCDDEERTGPASRPAALPGKFPFGQRPRENEFRNRYDEFLDAEGLLWPMRAIGDEDVVDLEVKPKDHFAKTGSSKQRYKMRLFGGKGVSKANRGRQQAAQHEYHSENMPRRSTVLSGAIDRVSMAADPWIDFITDSNTLPGVGKGRRPFRNAMKRLFRRGKHPDLMIKNSGE